jgi:hypothetical protein
VIKETTINGRKAFVDAWGRFNIKQGALGWYVELTGFAAATDQRRISGTRGLVYYKAFPENAQPDFLVTAIPLVATKAKAMLDNVMTDAVKANSSLKNVIILESGYYDLES